MTDPRSHAALDIAVTGLALRLPGANSLDQFWTNLAAGVSSISEVPARRWDKAALHGDPKRGNKTVSIWGGFIDGADRFDAEFFRITPREARAMDPQQRMALELSWNALEDGALRADQLAGSRTGVFMGVCHWDYAELAEGRSETDVYYPTGSAYAIIANRVSHFFDFRGPSLSVDTACSSSLTALEQATQALMLGACDHALVGGVNLCWSPRHFVAFSKAGMLARDGVCRAFDAEASGYVRGEGGVVMLLRRASDARRDGDPVHAFVRGISSNHGGRTSSLTVTNPVEQANLIAGLYGGPGVGLHDVDYIEAHGTGTPLGDPIELRGLKLAWRSASADADRSAFPHRCGVGSVKPNIGHLEGAAGLAGVAKVIAAMRNRQLPPTINFTRLNPLVTLENTPFHIVDRLQAWPPHPGGRRRHAGVSSFGFGGTNVHVVLEEGPVATVAADAEAAAWVPVSALDEPRLRALCAALLAWLRAELAADRAPGLADIAQTLRTGRSPMPERAAFEVRSVGGLCGALAMLADGIAPPGCLRGRADGATGAAGQVGQPGHHAEPVGERAFAAAWVDGTGPNWTGRRSIGRRLHMPGTAFIGDSHWLYPLDETAPPPAIADTRQGDVATASVRLTFKRDAAFIRDHEVHGRRVVPGVALLELVRAAGADLPLGDGAAQLRNVAWTRPLVLDADELVAELDLVRRDGGYDFRVLDAERRPCATGRLEASDGGPCEGWSLDALRRDHAVPVDASDLYAGLRASGVVHGAALRGVQSVWRGENSVLMRIAQPPGAVPGMVWQPAMLDSALQGAMLLQDGGKVRREEALVPFALDRLSFRGPTGDAMWAWLRPSPGQPGHAGTPKLDVDLLGEDGAVRVRMQGYTARRTAAPAVTPASTVTHDVAAARSDLLELTPAWRPAAAGGRDPTSACLVLAALSASDAAEVARRGSLDVHPIPLAAHDDPGCAAPRAFRACHGAVRSLLRDPDRTVRDVLVIAPGAASDPVHAPLAALLRTLHRENPSFSGKLVTIEAASLTVERVLAAIAAERGERDEFHIAYDADGIRLRRELEELPSGGPASSLLKRQGVYWITGGAGGIGRLLAEHLCNRHDARVLLTGRSSLPRSVEALRSRLNAGHLEYRAVDVTDAAATMSAASWLGDTFGRIDGAFHAAGVIDDGLIVSEPRERTAAVLATKIRGALNIDLATRYCALDFMTLFGSVAGAFGNAAQADYAFANAFLAAFAAHRQGLADRGLRAGATRVVDWPLWADGGMRVDDATRTYMRKSSGMVPLPSELGLAALDRALDRDGPVHRIVLHGERRRLEATLSAPRPAPPAPPDMPAPARDAGIDRDAAARPAIGDDDLLAFACTYLRSEFASVVGHDPERIRVDQKLSEYGIDSIMIVELTSRMEDDLGSLPKTLFFEHVDLLGVATYLLAEHRSRLLEMAGQPAGRAAPTPDPPPAPTRSAPAARPPRNAGGPGDIAVIGMSGRYPGGETLDEFWRMLVDGRDSFGPVPSERWPQEHIYLGQRDVLGKSVIKSGTFLKDIDAFDPRYFSISQRAAELLAPEVRLFLQAGVHALEDAGYSRETIARRYDGDVGVLVGSMNNSYGLYGFQNALRRGSTASGNDIGVLANMLSYFYNLTGPSIFVDTMCASSATCIHQAVRMLRGGECRMVVAGGVNLMLHPFDLISTSQAHYTSKTADTLNSYGLGADGTLLGEGVGAVVLKPLGEAEADGDSIYGVIKGSAMTTAGRRNGFTVPSPQLQARAIGKALDDAGVDARSISYLEGHGSATALGDPIEVKGAALAFGAHTRDRQYCALGSVKSNVAHLLSAAGLVGLTKVMLQLKHRTLVPSLRADRTNPAIDFAATPFYVQRESVAWTRPRVPTTRGVEEVPLRAGITSIGAGGANVHIVVEEHLGAPASAKNQVPASGRPRLMVFSAATPAALTRVMADLRAFVLTTRSSFDAIAYTLQVGRNEQPCRAAFPSSSLEELAEQLLARTRDGAAGEDRGGAQGAAPSPGPASDAAAAAAIARSDLDAIGRLWLAGVAIDWDQAWTGARPPRASLPPYPFERVRCWYPQDQDAPSVLRPLAFADRVHPWLGGNRSDLAGIRFGVSLRGDDLLDYVASIGRQRRFVGLALLDAALALPGVAGHRGSGLSLRNARWAQLPTPDETTPLEWRLARSGSGYAASLAGDDGTGIRFTVDVPHAADPAPAMAALPVPAGRTLDAAAFHARLAAQSYDHGPYLGCVREAVLAEGRSLHLRIAPPAQRHDPHQRAVRLASHVLAAIDQAVLILADGGVCPTAALCPVELDHLVVTRPEDISAVLVTRTGDGRGTLVEVRLLDGEDRVLGSLGGLLYADSAPAALTAPTVDAGTPDGPAADRMAAEAGPAGPDPSHDDQAALHRAIREIVAGMLKFALEEIDTRTHFHDFGFDSITLAALAAELNAELGARLSPAVFFEHPNIESLAAHLLERRGMAPRPARPAEPAPARTVPDPMPAVPAAVTADPRSHGGIAILGISGRFPGADSPDALWERLREGADLVRPYPDDRFDAAYRGAIEAADFPKWAGLLDRVAEFDADFFRISRLEAELMDPQHRIALEVVWEALEDAGYPPGRLKDDTGVFFGVSGRDYHHLLTASGVAPDALIATGNTHSTLANRISYVLDLHGPSQPIDTACSSSLVAIHRAVESLRSGACSMAIAGGVNLLLAVDTFVATGMAGMLSPHGRCKAFSSEAAGYVRAEGAGAVLLKPLGDALRDGDPIHGVIIGSAENHGGRANSLTAPNARAQAALIERAMHGIDPDSIGYIEAHGTGTTLGDAVEVGALANAYRALREKAGRPADPSGTCALGSVKSNLGHAEAAAGLTGIIRVLLSMRHGALTPLLHLGQPNPQLPLSEGGFELVADHRAWPGRTDASGRPWARRAGVSSFGFGGSNAHVVLEQAPDRPRPVPAGHGPSIVSLSGRSPAALRGVAGRLARHLRDGRASGEVPTLADLCWTLQVGREAMEHRLAFEARSIDEVVATLDEVADGRVPGRCHVGAQVRRRGGVDRGRIPRAAAAAAAARGDASAVMALWCGGEIIDWNAVGPPAARIVRLPTYPFERARFWAPDRTVRSRPDRAPAAADTCAAPIAAPPTIPDFLDRLGALLDGRGSIEELMPA